MHMNKEQCGMLLYHLECVLSVTEPLLDQLENSKDRDKWADAAAAAADWREALDEDDDEAH
jgi:hypothetical protein